LRRHPIQEEKEEEDEKVEEEEEDEEEEEVWRIDRCEAPWRFDTNRETVRVVDCSMVWLPNHQGSGQSAQSQPIVGSTSRATQLSAQLRTYQRSW
jgi:hypothetical protein